MVSFRSTIRCTPMTKRAIMSAGKVLAKSAELIAVAAIVAVLVIGGESLFCWWVTRDRD
jgi:hypothetical protein